MENKKEHLVGVHFFIGSGDGGTRYPIERTHSVVKVYGSRRCCYCRATRQVWRHQTNAPLLVKTSVETVPPHCMNKKRTPTRCSFFIGSGDGTWTTWPSGYEPDELPNCSTPRQSAYIIYQYKNGLSTKNRAFFVFEWLCYIIWYVLLLYTQ